MARNFGGGDENKQADMNAFVKGCDKIRSSSLGSTVLVVHHAGKTSRAGDRGSTVLRGAVDTKLELQRVVTKSGVRTDKLTLVSLTQKDSEEHPPIKLRLKRYDPSCIIEENAGAEVIVFNPEEKALKALTNAPAGLTLSEWRKETEIPKSTLQDVRDRLTASGKIIEDAKRYRVAAPAEPGQLAA